MSGRLRLSKDGLTPALRRALGAATVRQITGGGTGTHKYSAKPVTDPATGKYFASTKEYKRYRELLILQEAGKITDLELQPAYRLVVGGIFVCTYRADFRYRDEDGKRVVEDTKGFKTEVYKLKKKLMYAIHRVRVVEP